MMNWNTALDHVIQLYGQTVSVIVEETLTEKNQEIQSLQKKNDALEAEVAYLKELLQLQQQQRFGKSNESAPPDSDDENQDTNDRVTVSAHMRRKKKKKKGRIGSFDHLPHFQKLYDFSEEACVCPDCQGGLHLIKKNTTKQLEIVPLRYCVVEHIQCVYGCRACQTVVTPPKPPAPIPKAMAGASLLAEVLIHKYQYHQPLYRQSKQMQQDQITIPDNTLGHWVMHLGLALGPLYQAMWKAVLQQPQRYLQIDETPVTILKPNKKGYLWAYYAPHLGDHRGILLFELSESRAGEVAKKRLESFKGLIQTDGYSGYQSLRNREGITGLGCFTHARRKFMEVVKITQDQDGIAAEMIERLKPLYRLEARMKELELTPHTRKRLRQRVARPITQEIHRWLRSIRNKVPPKSKLGQAISYTLNQWRYLIAYLRHGLARIDTNDVENKIREIALGKKNWLFIGNKHSGIVHAIFYSLVISAILNEMNPRVYIHYLLTQIHAIRRGEVDPKTLLPHTIDRELLNQFAQEQIDFAKKIFDSS